MNELFAGSELADLIAKVDREERLSFEDGVRLFKSNDLLAIGYMADKVRRRKCGDKVYFASNRQIETAHGLDIRTNATMVYGPMESDEEKVEHLVRLRQLQDKTGGFLTFAPIAFQPENTGLEEIMQAGSTTGFADLKVLAAARVVLDNFAHIKASWIQIGLKLAQTSLAFGVDDLDGTVSEEQISHAAGAGITQAMTKNQLVEMIRVVGRKPVERDSLYNIVEAY